MTTHEHQHSTGMGIIAALLFAILMFPGFLLSPNAALGYTATTVEYDGLSLQLPDALLDPDEEFSGYASGLLEGCLCTFGIKEYQLSSRYTESMWEALVQSAYGSDYYIVGSVTYANSSTTVFATYGVSYENLLYSDEDDPFILEGFWLIQGQSNQWIAFYSFSSYAYVQQTNIDLEIAENIGRSIEIAGTDSTSGHSAEYSIDRSTALKAEEDGLIVYIPSGFTYKGTLQMTPYEYLMTPYLGESDGIKFSLGWFSATPTDAPISEWGDHYTELESNGKITCLEQEIYQIGSIEIFANYFFNVSAMESDDADYNERYAHAVWIIQANGSAWELTIDFEGKFDDVDAISEIGYAIAQTLELSNPNASRSVVSR